MVKLISKTFIVALVFGTASLFAGLTSAAEGEFDQPIPSKMARLASKAVLLDSAKVGDHYVAIGQYGIVITSNNGDDWNQVQMPINTQLIDLFFIDDKEGWAVGELNTILHTVDGGFTWEIQRYDFSSENPLLNVFFFDKNKGIAIGAYGSMVKTVDGGKTWEKAWINEEDDFHLNELVQLGDGTLIIAGEAGFNYRSRNAGETWEAMDVPYEGSFMGCVPLSDTHLLLYGLRGNIAESTDQGDTWRLIDSPASTSLMDATLTEDGKVVFVGLAGTIVVRDAQGNFSSNDFPARLPLTSIQQVPGSDNYLLMSARGAYKYTIK